MDEGDPRAVLAFAIAAAITKALDDAWRHRPPANGHGANGNGHDTRGQPPEAQTQDIRHALIICLAMLIEADGCCETEEGLAEAAERAGVDLLTQLRFMRGLFLTGHGRMWNIVTQSRNGWWE